MKIIKLTPTNQTKIINQSIRELKKGNLVVYPTETCYGLGIDPTNLKAVNKLLQFKTRREGKAFSVAVANQQMAEQYVKLNKTAQNIYQNFLPGPLTVISKIKNNNQIIKGVTSEFQTLGIRIPKHPFIQKLTKKFNKPITATSANVSYQSPPYSFSQWQKQTPKKTQNLISLWINAGKLPQKPPSTIIDTTINELTILRQGKIQFKNTTTETITKSENETHQLAKKIINTNNQTLQTNTLIIALQGDLGAGKTQFTKGIAKALNIKTPITSPTFMLVHEYQIPKTKNYLYHIDTWRMEKAKELLNIGFPKMLQPGNIVVIEWAEKVTKIIRKIVQKQHLIIWGDIQILTPNTRKWKFTQNL